ncbi:hypothetical protein EWM64_g4323 [Hericium alpestre]|uniref:ZZ-type domain-containing protein n=1 Tax=Hericium alpestre TaxID=135208 RepID=A0A4Z0A1I9_9AGAM|nr:hypothetical protein EWM64_g4323 [Hericium alpestre]
MSYDWPSGPVRGLASTAPHLTTRGLFGPRTPLPPPVGITQPAEIAQLKQNIDSALDRLHSSIEAASRESEKAAQAAQAHTLTEALASFRERKAASEQAVRRLFDQRASDDDAFKHVLTVLLEERQEREQQIQKEVDKVFADSVECVAGLEQALKVITDEAEENKPRRSAWQQLQPTFPSAPIVIAAPSTAPQPITITECQYLSGPDSDFFDFSSLTLRPADTWNDASGSSPQETMDSQSFSVPTISEASSPSVVMQPPQPGRPFDHRPIGARDQDLWDIVQLERILASPHGSCSTSSPASAGQNEGNPAPVHANALESTQPLPFTVPKHEDVRCAYCKIEITGANWQCITCTDVNICVDCEAAGIVEPLHAKHTSSHFMMMVGTMRHYISSLANSISPGASPDPASGPHADIFLGELRRLNAFARNSFRFIISLFHARQAEPDTRACAPC